MERIIDEFELKLDELMATNGITGADLVGRLNEVMLEFMVAAVPYLGVALFSDLAVENSFYKTTLRPRVYDRTRDVIGAIKGWPDKRVELGVANDSMWSLNYGVALDGLLRGVEIDVPRAAKRVTQLYLLGIPQFKADPKPGARRRSG